MYRNHDLMWGLDRTRREFEMKKISLNDLDKNENLNNGDYQLDPTEEYVINLEEELQSQKAIMTAFQIMGAPPALKNYHAWLFKNNFSYEVPNPTNEIVAPYYGVAPLWKTEYSQGIVVRAEDDDDYYIVMECSIKNKGYKHTKALLTMGGCM